MYPVGVLVRYSIGTKVLLSSVVLIELGVIYLKGGRVFFNLKTSNLEKSIFPKISGRCSNSDEYS